VESPESVSVSLALVLNAKAKWTTPHQPHNNDPVAIVRSCSHVVIIIISVIFVVVIIIIIIIIIIINPLLLLLLPIITITAPFLVR
jgi:hypothetical protein